MWGGDDHRRSSSAEHGEDDAGSETDASEGEVEDVV